MLPHHIAIIFERNFLGDVFLKHGKMLELGVTCDGSGPWEHCYFFKPENYTMSGNETCEQADNKATSKGKCNFTVVQYLRNNGEYRLILIVDDGLSHSVKQIGINVYKEPRYN